MENLEGDRLEVFRFVHNYYQIWERGLDEQQCLTLTPMDITDLVLDYLEAYGKV